jgi:predicted metalloprotease with PDZ domain
VHVRAALVRSLPVAFVLTAGCAGHPSTPGQDNPAGRMDIAYRIAMPDPANHLYDISLDLGRVSGEVVKLQLPVWSPGRYGRMDFAKNVQEFSATNGAGARVRWDKENGSLWRVYPAGAQVLKIRYRVYGNNLSGTFSVLDTAHANWNGASLFMYVDGHKPDPVRLRVAPPTGWHVINGASRDVDQLDFTFPNYDLLIDTPTEIAANLMIDTLRDAGRLYRIVVHHNGPVPRGARERFVRDVARIVRYENGVIAPPPLESYTFLFNLGYPGGDGMEHLYSTQIIDSDRWSDTAPVLSGIGTAAHEYFHVWNVKRIRPAALGPFDYTKEVFQPSLWVAEGWTQFYGEMAMYRAAITDRFAFYTMIAATVRTTSESPARKEVSARAASFHAPFWDGVRSAMETNRQSTFLSYYTKGMALAWLLDLEIRSRTSGTKSLDNVLRLLKERTWDVPATSYYLQGRGYTEEDVERAVTDVAGSDFHPWFERYVGGTDELPWVPTLALAGLKIVVRSDGMARDYQLVEDPAATTTQLRVRDGWLRGITSAPR